MQVYLIMNEADAHVDPVHKVFEFGYDAQKYVREKNSNMADDPEYLLEAVLMEVE